ncbi:MAG: polyphosphate polymerase domain-containing protein [Defluviitaleaceae bacterium]|nr:polyphosphate polymerase domain-containing protein [Defluviitaleaceae bacterium]
MQYRYENKYFINEHTATLLKQRIKGIMQPDPHGESYIVNNLYLDDRYDSFYNAKHLGRFVRDKYRLRYYNKDTSFIRLERKHKEGNLAYKDTTRITYEQYQKIKSNDLGFILEEDSNLWQLLAVIHRLKGLRPAAIFSYKREAYVYSPGNVRFTFDSPPFDAGEHLPTHYEPLTATYGEEEYSPLLLEVKFSKFLPEMCKRFLSGLPLAHTEMSKYCIARERGVLPYGQI